MQESLISLSSSSRIPIFDEVIVSPSSLFTRPFGRVNRQSINLFDKSLLRTSPSKLASSTVIVPFGSVSLDSFRISSFI